MHLNCHAAYLKLAVAILAKNFKNFKTAKCMH